MIESRRKIDEEAVKKYNEEQKDWTAYCPVCKKQIMSSLAELRAHKVNCHGG